MKLQFEGQQWRVRIDEDELETLLDGGTVHTASHAAGRFSLQASVTLTAATSPTLQGDAAQWTLTLPEVPVYELSQRLPTRDGLHFVLPAENEAQSLQLRFDVDVRDSARRLKAARRDG
jgi:hypothetical protein